MSKHRTEKVAAPQTPTTPPETMTEKPEAQPLLMNQSEQLGGITDSQIDKSDHNEMRKGLYHYDKSEQSNDQKSAHEAMCSVSVSLQDSKEKLQSEASSTAGKLSMSNQKSSMAASDVSKQKDSISGP